MGDRLTSYRPRLVLASASPSRRQILASAGIAADVVVSGVDESTITESDINRRCQALARLKAQAVADQLKTETSVTDRGESPSGAPTLVLGCDSLLEFDGQVLGKPADAATATARWRRMRGRSGVLHTGHAVVEVASGHIVEAVSRARVHFAAVTDAEIEAYVATGEPLQVAGAFTIEGYGAPFVARIEGDPGTVLGLSLPLLRHLLDELGVPITALWR